MEQVRFNYSLKNIPIPTRTFYMKRLIEKTENVLKRMRWKAFFYGNHTEQNGDEHFGFKTRKCPSQVADMVQFENDVLNMIKNVKFRRIDDEFQRKLKKDINTITTSKKAFIPADKTTNLYKLSPEEYNKHLLNNITAAYKRADKNTYDNINKSAKCLAKKLKIDDRMECMAKSPAFVTFKDHKENFDNKPTCRLINPAKSELGLVSKRIVENINTLIRNKTSLHQWGNTASVIEWYKRIPCKDKTIFITFDIDNFYPSISEDLLKKAIEFAKQFTNISSNDIDIIMHARKSLLFYKDEAWVKKESNNTFDVTMGSFDGAEICELVGLYLLQQLSSKFKEGSIGLYRDDGLAAFKNTSGPQAERLRKKIHQYFKEHGLSITINTNLKIVNFLDVTFNLKTGEYYPYTKPNNTTLYIHNKSNHPPTILKQLPETIGRRISDLSCNEAAFNKAKPLYEEALKSSGFNENLSFSNHTAPSTSQTNQMRARKRKIIWYNPPFSNSVQTNIGAKFLALIQKHFPANHKFHKIFNKNTVKVSYSCVDNMASIIRKHNKKILNNEMSEASNLCNCRNKDQCPLDNKCLVQSIVYNACVTTTNNPEGTNYIGLTEGTFKQRFTQHKSSFQNAKTSTATELSKHIWKLKSEHKDFEISWSIVCPASAYNNKSKRCNLCLTEKFHIIRADNTKLLNKKDELVSKCRHENKYYIKNYRNEIT